MNEKDSVEKAPASRAVIWDIAHRSGVSIATVSRVLNGRPDVSDATRERVMDSIRELGYVSNRHARALVSGRTSYIGFTVPKVEHFLLILEGATEAIAEHDAHLVVCPTGYEHEREVSLLERLQRGGTDGALLVLPSENVNDLLQLRRRDYPFVVIDPRFPLSDEIPVVSTANILGGRAATEHLISLGHRRIGAITGYANWCATIDRLAGYHSALITAGLQPSPKLIVTSDFTIDGGYQAAQSLLSLDERPGAIFAFNDDMAVGVLRAAQERGIRVPDDLSLIGFDDTKYARVVTPPLTTIRQPLAELGRAGVEVLYRILNGQQLDATRMELSTRLVVRASTARYEPSSSND